MKVTITFDLEIAGIKKTIVVPTVLSPPDDSIAATLVRLAPVIASEERAGNRVLRFEVKVDE